MTNFLPAGIINDRLADICRLAELLQEALPAGECDEAEKYAHQISDTAGELLKLIQSFSCQPLIYTGKGSTEEVITRLEWLLAFSDMDHSQFTASKRKKRRKKRPLPF